MPLPIVAFGVGFTIHRLFIVAVVLAVLFVISFSLVGARGSVHRGLLL